MIQTKVNTNKVIFGDCEGNAFAVVYDSTTDIYVRLEPSQAVYGAKPSDLFRDVTIPESDGLSFYADDGRVERLLKELGIDIEGKGTWTGWTYSEMIVRQEPFPHTETLIRHRSKGNIMSDIESVMQTLRNYKPKKRK